MDSMPAEPTRRDRTISMSLTLDEETLELIELLQCEEQDEDLEQLFKRALFALSQQHFAQAWPIEAELEAEALNLAAEEDELLSTMNQLHGKIFLLESEYITPLKETVKQLQKKKTELQLHIHKLKEQNQRLRKTALRFRHQRDTALQRQKDERIELHDSLIWAQLAIPHPGTAHSPQRHTFLHWLTAQRHVPYTWQAIAEALNQANIPTPSAKSSWNAHLLRSLARRQV